MLRLTVNRNKGISLFFCSFQEPQEEDDDDDDEEEKAPNPPMMVPMADMLNHVSKHNANLEFTPVTTCLFKGHPMYFLKHFPGVLRYL